MKKRGLLFIISGPAGSGKGTIVKRVRELAEFDFSVSATTRAPRPGEIDGVHYFFTDKEEFRRKIAAGEMLEHAEYVGNYYGTPKKPVDDALSAGKNIILDIDVQGALQVKTKMPEAVMIFVLPPDFETLMRRIRGPWNGIGGDHCQKNGKSALRASVLRSVRLCGRQSR